MPEEAELPAEALRGERIEIRYPPVVKDERYDAHERDHHKGQAPGERSGEQRRDRDAEEVREGHSGAHQTALVLCFSSASREAMIVPTP